MRAGYSSSLNIVVLGYIVRGPLGGMVWHHMQYVLGLKKLGHRVVFLEDSDDYDSCFNPQNSVTGRNPDYGLSFIQQAFNSVGIGDCWGYYDAHTDKWHGPQAETAVEFCRSADLLLNVSAINPLRSWFEGIDVRVLIDTDPVFTQISNLQDPAAKKRAEKHTHFYTFGENVNKAQCTIPNDGIPWRATRQPIVIDCWSDNRSYSTTSSCYTSILQWDSYAEKELDGVRYGMKSRSFESFMQLPQKTRQKLELAIGSDSAPREQLTQLGWGLKDPLKVTKTPQSYQQYIKQSKAEFSINKHGYVVSGSGWFSERSANYLASGRPVVTQSTGFSSWLPVGAGVLSFDTAEEAVVMIDQVNSNYEHHSNAAYDLAVEYFCHTRVLEALIDDIYQHTSLERPLAVNL